LLGFRKLSGIHWARAAAGAAIVVVGGGATVLLPLEGSAILPPALAHYGISLAEIMVFIGLGLIMIAVREE
jgi:hypothetical protein